MRKNITSWALPAFLFVLLISSFTLISGEKKPMTFMDAINVKRISNLRLSPDCSQLLFIADSDPNLKDYYYQANFFTVPAKGGTPQAPLPDFIYEVDDTHWSADGKSIYFTANMGVHRARHFSTFRTRPEGTETQTLQVEQRIPVAGKIHHGPGFSIRKTAGLR